MNNDLEFEWHIRQVTPLCGWWWFQKHKHDYTEQDIASLTIVVSANGKELPAIRNNGSKGVVRDLVELYASN